MPESDPDDDPNVREARNAFGIGCLAYLAAAAIGLLGAFLVTCGQPYAVILIPIAVGLWLWSRHYLKSAAERRNAQV